MEQGILEWFGHQFGRNATLVIVGAVDRNQAEFQSGSATTADIIWIPRSGGEFFKAYYESPDEFLEISQLELCCRMLERLGKRLTG